LTPVKTMLYKHILVPTDGSALSRKAVRTAVALARALDARITALYVVPEGVPTLFSGDKLYGSGVLAPEYKDAIRRAAEGALGFARSTAEAAGVPCSSARTLARAPWQAIVHTARARDCDLIVMASHGKRGLAALGSQTMKAVAHTRIPVLVCR
jgi:nucleotide-binding universal stress UspA family protein